MKASFAVLLLFFTFSQKVLAYRPISDEKLKDLIESFHYTPDVQLLRTSQTSCTAQDIEYTTTYPQRLSKLNIQAKTFIPPSTTITGPVPVVFMLPPLGGSNTLDLRTAETLCKNKIAAILITTNLTGLDSKELVPVTDHDHTHRRVAAAVKGAMIVARTYPEINIEKMGLFGASLGGILGSVAYSVLPEISAATFLVNGGDVANILAMSDQSPIVKLKNDRMKEMGFTTAAEYENYLNNNLEIDPLHFAKLINPNTIKFFLSKKDKSVPSVDQMAYYNALGQPKETKFFLVGHVETIIGVLGIGGGKQQIADWFNSRFAQANPRLSPDIETILQFKF